MDIIISYFLPPCVPYITAPNKARYVRRERGGLEILGSTLVTTGSVVNEGIVLYKNAIHL